MYKVYVDENFYKKVEAHRKLQGEFSTCDEAIAQCKKIIDDSLLDSYDVSMTAAQLHQSYMIFGLEPIIVTHDISCVFSASDYIETKIEDIVTKQPSKPNSQTTAPTRSMLRVGMKVAIILKQDQPTGRETVGIIDRMLTGYEVHPHGIKVMLTDGLVGRVKRIV